jgi:hypothetical protein
MPAATLQSLRAKLLLFRLLRYQVIHGWPTTWQSNAYGRAAIGGHVVTAASAGIEPCLVDEPR